MTSISSSLSRSDSEVSNFNEIVYKNESKELIYSSSKVGKIAASAFFAIVVAGGAAVLAVADLGILPMAVVGTVLLVSAIAALFFAHAAYKDATQHTTCDYEPVKGEQMDVQIGDQKVEIDKVFFSDCTRLPDDLLIETVSGTKSLREMFHEEFELLSEEAPEEQVAECQEKVTKRFVEFLLKELGPDRCQLVPEITALFSQNSQITLNGKKDTFASELKGSLVLLSGNFGCTSTLQIPKEGPVRITVRGSGKVDSLIFAEGASRRIEYTIRPSFEGTNVITVGLDGNHMDSRIALSL